MIAISTQCRNVEYIREITKNGFLVQTIHCYTGALVVARTYLYIPGAVSAKLSTLPDQSNNFEISDNRAYIPIITLLQIFLSRYRRQRSASVGFDFLAAIENPVNEVKHGKDDRKTFAGELVDSPRVVLAVVRRRRSRRERGRQRAGHHRCRLLMLLMLG